jgi:hypothetical protein
MGQLAESRPYLYGSERPSYPSRSGPKSDTRVAFGEATRDAAGLK